jgi:hypothetical protein
MEALKPQKGSIPGKIRKQPRKPGKRLQWPTWNTTIRFIPLLSCIAAFYPSTSPWDGLLYKFFPVIIYTWQAIVIP